MSFELECPRTLFVPSLTMQFLHLVPCMVLFGACTEFEQFGSELDDALASLDSLRHDFVEKRQLASEDAALHRRVIAKLPDSEHFAKSTEPRARGPHPEVMFEVGQVVRHKIWGYIAVIVGWDEYCKAPEAWIKRMFSHQYAPTGKKLVAWRTMPNYSVLVLQGGSGTPDDVRYVPQVNIELLIGGAARVDSQHTEPYFHSFSERCSGFVPLAWLRERYPEDVGCVYARPGSQSVTAEL